jgi:protein transport protein SEC61 subunit gamma-like protein
VRLFKKREKTKNNDKSFVDRAWNLQNRIEARRNRFGKGKYGRVLKMARKPTNDEFLKTSKITFVGILLIGGLGFLVFLLAKQLAPWIAEALGLV